jgi:hypothetical protein
MASYFRSFSSGRLVLFGYGITFFRKFFKTPFTVNAMCISNISFSFYMQVAQDTQVLCSSNIYTPAIEGKSKILGS